jgi:hypothetical protein
MADILQRLTTTLNSGLGNIGRQNNQFRQVAQQQNGSIMGFMKDIGRYFSRQSQQQSSLNNSLNEINQNTNLNSQKIEQSNVLLKDSVNILSQLLNETKQMAEGMFKLVNLSESGQAFGQQNNQNNTTNSMLSRIMSFLGIGAAAAAGGAAAAVGLDALGSEGAQTFTNLASGGSNYGGPATSSGASNTPGGNTNQQNFSQPVTGQVGDVLKTIRTRESGGDYSINSKSSSASGAYQFIDSTWRSLTRKYGIGNDYARAAEAPPQVQDAVAAKYVEEILSQNGGDVSKVPLVWYTGNAQGQMSSEAIRANNGLTAQAYQQKWLSDFSRISGKEADDSMAPHGTLVEKDSPPIGNNMTGGGGGGSVQERQAQLAGVRKLPLSSQMRSVLERAAAATGVQAVVYSGGQPPKGSGGARTGSTRHDNGNAADLWLEKDGRKLSDTNPQDKAIMAKFVSASVQAGATGVGAGHGYMGPSNIHVGFGKQATWGGADWIKQAASGIFNNKDMTGSGESGSGENYDPGDRSGAQMVGGGNMMGGGGMPGMGMPGMGLMGMIPGMGGGLPAAAMIGGGLFGMAMSALSGIGAAIGSSNNRPETKRDNAQEKNVEGDDAIAALAPPREPPAIKSIRSAAISNDLSMTNLSQTMQAQQQSSSQQQNYSGGSPKHVGDTRSGYPTTGPASSTTPWYMQLAGRLDYSESMKMFKGGVIT